MYFFKSIFSETFAVRFEDRRGFSYVVFNRAGDHNRRIGLSLYNNLWPENIIGTIIPSNLSSGNYSLNKIVFTP